MSLLKIATGFPNKLAKKAVRWHGARKDFFRKYGNTLGPAINERYLSYRDHCREQFHDEVGQSRAREVGTSLVNGVMPAAAAAELSQKVSDLLAKSGSSFAKGSSEKPLMQRVDRPISEMGREVVDIFHHPEVDRQVRAFFGCHYRIQWLDCYRSFPVEQVRSSWLWHSDNVPVESLKVMLHLTDAGERQGATRFMDGSDSLAYFEAGYRGDTSHRTEDLESFAKKKGLPYRPYFHDAKAGDVMLFQNNALHRGVPPSDGYRDVLTYMILPNPVPWDRQLEIDGFYAVEAHPGPIPEYPALHPAA